MTLCLRWWITGVMLSGGVLLLSAPGTATGKKESWQAILPKGVYQELTRREIDRLQALLNDITDERALARAEVAAALLAALTMSVNGESASDELQGTRQTALRLVLALKNKEQRATARELAAQLDSTRPALKSKTDTANWRTLLAAPTLMVQFLPKGEGGDGIHPKLQSSDALRHAKNGILEKIRHLSTNELTGMAIEAEARELELLGYRSAVIGSLTYYLVPAKMKPNKTSDEWRELAIQMRDHSVALAEGARKRDTVAVLKASAGLRMACSRCHNAF